MSLKTPPPSATPPEPVALKPSASAWLDVITSSLSVSTASSFSTPPPVTWLVPVTRGLPSRIVIPEIVIVLAAPLVWKIRDGAPAATIVPSAPAPVIARLLAIAISPPVRV